AARLGGQSRRRHRHPYRDAGRPRATAWWRTWVRVSRPGDPRLTEPRRYGHADRGRGDRPGTFARWPASRLRRPDARRLAGLGAERRTALAFRARRRAG